MISSRKSNYKINNEKKKFDQQTRLVREKNQSC